jgi:hypothetical protein
VASRNDGDLFVAGTFIGSFVLGPSNLTATAGDPALDAFLARTTSANVTTWAKAFGSFGIEAVNAVAATPDGDAIVAGSFQGTITFAPVATLTSPGGNQAFLAKVSQ